MYLPKHFEEKRPEVLHGLIAASPLATLITVGSAGIEANHIPLLLNPAAGEFGTLRGHLARANGSWRGLAAGVETLAIFQGAEGYISPNWYPTKAEHGKVVPTWNYCVVHAYGELKVIDDAAWLRRLVDELTQKHEAGFARPWSVNDAPVDYIDAMLKAIVGIEMRITRLIGKWKMSQNQPPQNVAGVLQGLAGRGVDAKSLAGIIAELAAKA